jgi:hypothetical protein
MHTMGPRSATQLLQLPVQLHGIRLGRPVDLLLDPTAWRVLGYVVLCGDEIERFLVYPAADQQEDKLAVQSALLLLEDVDFYRDRARSLRSLLGGAVVSEGHEAGELRDLLVGRHGNVEALVVEQDETTHEVAPGGVRIAVVSTA